MIKISKGWLLLWIFLLPGVAFFWVLFKEEEEDDEEVDNIKKGRKGK